MGVEALQTYLENECKEAVVPVDIGKMIVKMAQEADGATDATGATGGTATGGGVGGKISLIIDAECCLDRLYGGLHADWFSGGQWNRMYEFLSAVNNAANKSGVKLLVFTNGALEKSRIKQWAAKQVGSRCESESRAGVGISSVLFFKIPIIHRAVALLFSVIGGYEEEDRVGDGSGP